MNNHLHLIFSLERFLDQIDSCNDTNLIEEIDLNVQKRDLKLLKKCKWSSTQSLKTNEKGEMYDTQKKQIH